MTPRQYWDSHSADEVKAMAEFAGIKYESFRNIALYGKPASARVAAKLAWGSKNLMSEMEVLYQERYPS